MSIHRIKGANGEWVEDTAQLQSLAVTFFRDLLAQDSPMEMDSVDFFLNLVPRMVTAEDNAHILSPISLQEVKESVFSLDADSAPGPDGFSGKFFQSCWNVIADDLLLATQEFFAGVPLPRSIASTLIVLLPT